MGLFPIQLNACWYTEWQNEIGLFAFPFSSAQHAPWNDMLTVGVLLKSLFICRTSWNVEKMHFDQWGEEKVLKNAKKYSK